MGVRYKAHIRRKIIPGNSRKCHMYTPSGKKYGNLDLFKQGHKNKDRWSEKTYQNIKWEFWGLQRTMRVT